MNPTKPLEYYIFRKMYQINCIIHFHCMYVSFPIFFLKLILFNVFWILFYASHVHFLMSLLYHPQQLDSMTTVLILMKLILSLIITGNGAQTQVCGILNFNFSKCMLILHQDFNTLNTSPCI